MKPNTVTYLFTRGEDCETRLPLMEKLEAILAPRLQYEQRCLQMAAMHARTERESWIPTIWAGRN